MGFTPNLGLSYFDFGDRLDAAINVQKEIDRFLLIDKELFGLYNVVGNGVISGWLVEDNGFTTEQGISISITPGIGIINFLASESTFPDVITALPINSQFFV